MQMPRPAVDLTKTSVVHGDCREVVRSLPDAVFHSIVTDPPYGLSFMGAEWDHEVPGAAYWRDFLRVVRPGAYLVAFGGPRKWHRLACAIEDAGWEIRDTLQWLYGQGFPKSKDASGAGPEWAGWGTALKPGWEPIILARAPLGGSTLHENLVVHGAGALNIDACRIDVLDQKGGASYAGGSGRIVGRAHGEGIGFATRSGDPNDGKGRWPANVVLDEEAAALLDEQTGTLVSGKVTKTYEATLVSSVALGAKRRDLHPGKVFSDAGGGSRFFYCAKASTSERTHAGAVDNDHPTVKPQALMRWLLRLVTPPGGLVLDPFVGSGSTAVAGVAENFTVLGIDQNPRAVQISRERLSHAS